jgi:hypothetical protein
MKASPHLLVYISAHGFGHVAQTAPVLNALRERMPELRLTLCTAAPPAQLESRISGEFHHIAEAVDFGMVMASAMDVLVEPSMQAYATQHHDWAAGISRETQRIIQLAPDFVLSNIACLPLAAAKQLGIPCVAMCSLNWADIFDHYCGTLPGAVQIRAQMLQAYASADAFLQLTPALPMTDLSNLLSVGPVARIGQNSRAEINAKLALRDDEHLVLVTLGGIASRLPMERWPHYSGVRWLVQSDWGVEREDVLTIESLEMDFIDVLASCDVLLCKPGYGSFVEAACNGVPVLYVGRPDWPEQPYLVDWLATNGRCAGVERGELEQGAIGGALAKLLVPPTPMVVVPSGIAAAADYLARSISIASP